MSKVQRNIEELEKNASKWWPEVLMDKYAIAAELPLLLSTQDDFLNILALCKSSPFQVFNLIKAAEFPANLFLKHLAVLSDFGGEPIQRLGRSFKDIFPASQDGKHFIEFLWNGSNHKYEFKKLPINGLNNKRLAIQGGGLVEKRELDDLLSDMIVLLLFASTSAQADQAGLIKCEIGTLLGNEELLTTFVRQRYIVVSRITSGASANRLGQLAQTEVVDFLKMHLDDSFKIKRNGNIPVVGLEIPFDIVVERNGKKAGIEISFQVTTNSTIERKAGQAEERQNALHKAGHKVAYVIDGAGNFQRSSAIARICSHSDCTVAYSLAEFKVLTDWLKNIL